MRKIHAEITVEREGVEQSVEIIAMYAQGKPAIMFPRYGNPEPPEPPQIDILQAITEYGDVLLLNDDEEAEARKAIAEEATNAN